MNKVIIIINGVGTSGKDTFVEFCREVATSFQNKKVLNYSTIDPVKEIGSLLGADKTDKSEKNRKLWSDLKNLWVEYNNGPTKKTLEFLKTSQYDYVFVHCREPKEIEKLKQAIFEDTIFGEVITVLVTRHSVKVPDNESDRSVFGYKYDFEISNDSSLEELKKQAVFFMNHLSIFY